MDPEVLNFERAAPCESCQPCADRSITVARKDGERAVIDVACGGEVVADQLLFDEAHIGFRRGIVNDHVMSHGMIGLVVVYHHSSLLRALPHAYTTSIRLA